MKEKTRENKSLINNCQHEDEAETAHQLAQNLRKVNSMLRVQKKKLLKEKNALKKWGEDLSLLNELSKAVVATLDADKIVHTAFTKMQEIVPHDIFSVVLFKQKKLWMLSLTRLCNEEITEIKSHVLSAIKELTDIAKEDVYKMAVKHLKKDNSKAVRGSSSSVRNYKHRLLFPMETGTNRIGAIQLIRYSNEPFSEHQYNVVSMIVSTLTLALRNSEIHREVQEMATTDSLTGLFNKRYFCDTLSKQFKSTLRYQTPVSLILIDLDNFKSINDRFGHQAGDAVLRDVSSLINKSLREIDVPVRFGGDEIALILPETVMEQAFFVAKRIKKLIEGNPIEFEQKCINVTASFGISSCPSPMMKTAEDMVAAADKALYDAKRYGRNRIKVSENIFSQDNAYLGSLVF